MGLDILNLASFTVLSIIITLNNSVITLVLGPIFLPLYSFAKSIDYYGPISCIQET